MRSAAGVFLILGLIFFQATPARAVLVSRNDSSADATAAERPASSGIVPAFDKPVSDVLTSADSSRDSSKNQAESPKEASDPYSFGYKKTLPPSVAVKPVGASPPGRTVSGTASAKTLKSKTSYTLDEIEAKKY